MKKPNTDLLSSILYSLPTNTPVYLGETDHELQTIKAICENGKCVIRLWFNAGDAQ